MTTLGLAGARQFLQATQDGPTPSRILLQEDQLGALGHRVQVGEQLLGLALGRLRRKLCLRSSILTFRGFGGFAATFGRGRQPRQQSLRDHQSALSQEWQGVASISQLRHGGRAAIQSESC